MNDDQRFVGIRRSTTDGRVCGGSGGGDTRRRVAQRKGDTMNVEDLKRAIELWEDGLISDGELMNWVGDWQQRAEEFQKSIEL